MIAYHGTTHRRAQRICVEGFKPKKPSRRVWFAANRHYAKGRAKTQARRAHDRPVILVCELDLGRLRALVGKHRVFCTAGGIIAVDGPVPVTVLRSFPHVTEQPTTPDEIAAWANDLLRLKPYKGVSRRHPGVLRLSRWIAARFAANPDGRIHSTELLDVARHWLPDFFEGVEIDASRLHAHRKVTSIELNINLDAEVDALELDPREDEALECLLADKPERRTRGLALLEKLVVPDLFDWCVMCLEDESVEVRVAALHTMRRSAQGDPEVIAPLADSEDRRVRAAAIAAIARHAGEDAAGWIEYGLKDPSRCVRVESAALLSALDPGEHRRVFELALYDPNPEIRRRAQKLTAGKSYAHIATWPGQAPTA